MAFHYFDVLTFAFSPRDFQIELLAAACEKNIITCLSQNTSKEFISLKLIQEFGFELRRKKNNKCTIYLSNRKTAYNLIHYLTDLKIINLNEVDDSEINWENLLDEYQVIILEAKKCLDALLCFYITFERINLIIVDNCHCKDDQASILEIFTNYYTNTKEKPKIFGLAGPIHNAQCPSARLGAELELLEYILKAKAETCSDIVTVLRYSPKPIEIVAECSPPKQNDVTDYLRNLILTRKAFIKDHRYDLSEIYGDYMEELKSVPDPTLEPLKYLDDFLCVLDELGAYCADKAALSLLIQIEKQKIKTPYERHFLLLCLVSTTFIQVRSFCESIFQQIKNEKERIDTYSSPKVQRILEVLRLFKPEKSGLMNRKFLKNQENAEIEQKCNSEGCIEIMNDIKSSNINNLLTTTSNNIQQISNNLETLKDSVNKLNNETQLNSAVTMPMQMKPHYNKFRFKNRKKVFYQRPNQRFYNQNESDALCGLIFCNSTFTTKTLFCLFCEVSRHDPDLKFLNVQYTVDRTADPITEPKEYEMEHRKQEEVLKKFRMHECNLLISTSVLEEGFDLPKCNLVVRWNPPDSYRSYVQCKGRARAPNALHIIMVSPKIKNNIEDQIEDDDITNSNHKFICDFIRKDKSGDGSEKSMLEISGSSENSGFSEMEDSGNEETFPTKKCNVELAAKNDNEDDIENVNYENVENCTNQIIDKLAEYMEIEKMLIRKCENKEAPPVEFDFAEKFTAFVQPYKPLPHFNDGASVNLSTAIALVNKYCAKLPSDTFTKLTPIWRCCKATRNGHSVYQYTLRLPINSPIKHDILGLPMPTRILARRVAALIACRILHQSGELDDNLQPIGKEGFKAFESDWENFELEKEDEQIVNENCEPRPGTTKRRQYYYKRIASVFSNCRPTTATKAYLYHIRMTLQCPIPEEQNTRGRKIYPPEDAIQSFGILTTKKISKISAFPIFTRSGEVKVSLQLLKTNVTLTEDQLNKINTFINYTFTNVLRLRKYLMLFDPEAVENSFFVVPVFNDNASIEIDWNFLELIKENKNMQPSYVSDEDRKAQGFDVNKFKDAVVMPWYRNQDQPQYFYVAEICYHLSPESSFPGENYSTFREYYFKKYAIEIQNKKQPLLDVDHTSARLNFLTPRYVNRKGVALPTSSEETKRAKRENLEQKQILVPELCTVHPFPASLWRAAVCLPCVLYRFNALLLADEIRMKVSDDLGLGVREITREDFEWPMLDFGWTLADVLKKTRDAKITDIDDDDKDVVDDKEEPPAAILDDPEKEKEDLEKEKTEKTANDLLEEVDEKLKNDGFTIGTWSNEMAENIPLDDDDELGLLPPNLELCSTRNTNIRYGSPTSWLAGAPGTTVIPYSDSDDEIYNSDEEFDYAQETEAGDHGDDFGFKIEFKSDHLAEAVETEEEVQRRQRKLEFINETFQNEREYQLVKNKSAGFNFIDHTNLPKLEEKIECHEKMFQDSISELKEMIRDAGVLVKQNEKISSRHRQTKNDDKNKDDENPPELSALVPYLDKNEVENSVVNFQNNLITLDELYKINEIYTRRNPKEKFQVVGSGDIFDRFADNEQLEIGENHVKEIKLEISNDITKYKKPVPQSPTDISDSPIKYPDQITEKFSFDYQPNLENHPGPSPSIILQALTMSNANDGINLERLETIGDSFLKYAITTYLYCTYENVHEGKLSHLRSKQVSNLNLYRLGRKKILGESMIATKFEPHDNWLPPCYFVPKELEQALIDAKIPACYWNLADLPDIKKLSSEEICVLVRERAERLGLLEDDSDGENEMPTIPTVRPEPETTNPDAEQTVSESYPCFIPYNLVTQHSIPDKSIADCVEALIGAYLIECGARGALLFMAWLGIRVIPVVEIPVENDPKRRVPGSTNEYLKDEKPVRAVYGHWVPPKSPLLRCTPHPEETLELLLDGFSEFEMKLGYKFNDRSYLLQAMTHASYSPNRLTDCYQRLEFLGDAVLDYLITRHLYEDPRQHSPGALTDLRSALVNNTIFASLAVRHDFHKYFRHLSPGLNEVIDRFVRIQHENGHSISEEYYLLSEEECDEAEDVEVPKALGDVFESVAGAIFLDSNMSLDCVWHVYNNMMKPEIEQFSCSVPKSPIRELLELEPETAKFGKPEKLADGRRVRVTVEVFGKGIFRGIGRNYRIAKCTAAKCALRQLKKQGLINKRH